MASCSAYVTTPDCESCEFKFACRYYNINDSDYNNDDPCSKCEGKQRPIVKEGYNIGPRWWSK